MAGALEDLVTAAGISGLIATDNTDGTFTLTGTAGTNFSVKASTADSTGGISVENTGGKVTVELSREGVFRQDTNGKGLITSGGLDLTVNATGSNNLSDYTVDDFVNFIQEAATARATNGAQMSRLEQSSALLTTNQANIENLPKPSDGRRYCNAESTQFAKHNILVQSSALRCWLRGNSVPNVALQLLG